VIIKTGAITAEDFANIVTRLNLRGQEESRKMLATSKLTISNIGLERAQEPGNDTKLLETIGRIYLGFELFAIIWMMKNLKYDVIFDN